MLIYLPLFMLLFATANGFDSKCLSDYHCCSTTTDKKSYQRNNAINVSFVCIDTSVSPRYYAIPTTTGDGTPLSYDYTARIVPAHMEYDPYEMDTRVLLSIPYFGKGTKRFSATELFSANEIQDDGQHKVFLARYLRTNSTPIPKQFSYLIGISESFNIQSPFSCHTKTEKKLYNHSDTI